MDREALLRIRDGFAKSLADLDILLAEAPPAVVVPGVTPLAWGAKVSPLFRERIRTTGRDFNLDPNWLMACMAFETGRTFSPSVKNPGSTATGLIRLRK